MDYSNLDGMTIPTFYQQETRVDHTCLNSIEGQLVGFTSNQLMDAVAARLFNGENSNISDYSMFNLWSLLDHAITERGQQRFEHEAFTDESMYYQLEDSQNED